MTQFPERHPLLGFYSHTARMMFLLGLLLVLGGIGMGPVMTHFVPPAPGDLGVLSLKYWGYWLENFGEGYGSVLMFLAALFWLYGRLARKQTLFGDRIRREY